MVRDACSAMKRSTSAFAYVTCVAEIRTHPHGPRPCHRHLASVRVLMPMSCAALAAEMRSSKSGLR